MNESALMRALAKRIGEDEGRKPAKPQCPEAAAHDLLVRYRKLQEKHEFKPGDLVRFKDGLCSSTILGKGVPLVVIAVGADDTRKMLGDTLPRELGNIIVEVDMVCGIVDQNDNHFDLYPVESRRFEPWPYPAED